MSVVEHYHIHKNQVEVVEHNGGSFGLESGLVGFVLKKINKDFATATPATRAEINHAQVESREMTTECGFILGSNRGRYGKLLEDLKNAYTQGENKYPASMMDTYKLLENWKHDPRNAMIIRPPAGSNEVAFTNFGSDEQDGTTLANVGRHPHIKCFWCQQFGHFAGDCDKDRVNRNGTGKDVQLFVAGMLEDEDDTGFVFTNLHSDAKLPKTWILLDNQSTVNAFFNKELLNNIGETESWMRLHCNE